MKARILQTVAGVAILGTALAPRIPQPLSYHHFADQRSVFGIANGWNVLSNIAFLIVGIWGLWAAVRLKASIAYSWFFIGVLMTAFGSAYYHHAPDNWHLVWDRLPMTVGFMSLTAAIIEERFDTRWGQRLLWPLMLVGAGSVFYWYWTETVGRGDLRPYALIQFLPLILVVLMLCVFPRPGMGSAYLAVAIVFYTMAKIAELEDGAIYRALSFVSGHTLKHLLAAAGCASIVLMIEKRRAIAGPASI